MKKTLTMILLGILLLSAFPFSIMKVQSSPSVAPEVICVPFNGQLAAVPHDAWIGKEIILKGTAHDKDGDNTMAAYKWDFGDGYSTDWVSGVNPYVIEAKHTYTGTMADGTSYGPGKYFTAWLHVKDNTGLEGEDSYFIAIRDKTLDVEVNVALDNGLWWLHKQQTRGAYGDGTEYGYWHSSYGYDVSFTAASTEAFELQGHLPSGDRSVDPYVETVQRGLNYLFNQFQTYSISQDASYCPLGNPDINNNGIGLACFSGDINRQIYETGMSLMAISSSRAPDRIAATGTTNVIGRAYKDIAQDMVDFLAWGQSDPYTGAYEGGWRYYANYGQSDNSVSQWPVIGMEAAERNYGTSGLTIPTFIKPELLKWLAYSQGGDGGFGYQGPGSWENTAKTGAGCAMLSWAGVTTTDAKFQNALSFMDTHWYDTASTYTNFGDYYTMYGIMKGMRIPDPNIQSIGSHDWYTEYARYIVDQQNGYGGEYVVDTSWLGQREVTDILATAWAMAILTPTLVKPGPVAEAGPNVDNFPPTIALEFDASGSYHRDPTKNIILYEWDFDGDGTWDYSGPAPKVEHAYPAYYNPDGSIDWGKTTKDYTATLRVADNNDPPLHDIDTRVVHITPPPWKPIADPNGPYEGSVGVPIQLDGSKSYAPGGKLYPPGHPWYETIAKYEWDLDNDGKFDDSTDVKPSYSWSSEGTYSVGLRVTDSQPSGTGGTFGPLDSDSKYTTVVIRRFEQPDLSVTDVRPVQVVWHSDVNHDSQTDLVAGKMTTVLVTVVSAGKLESDQNVEIRMTCNGHEYTQTHTVAELLQNKGLVEFYFDAPESTGEYTISIDVDPQNQITESNEDNNNRSVEVTVKDTNSLYLTYIPVYATSLLPLGADPPWGYGPLNRGDYFTMVENSGKFISATYPISEEEFTNRLIDVPYFGSSVPVIGMELDAIGLWASGELASLGATDRVVGVVPDDYFSFHFKGRTVGISFPGIPAAVLCSKEDWSSPSHEIGHTYGLNLKSEEYTPTYLGNDANGFCVALHSEVTHAICLMGSLTASGSFEDDYRRIWVCDETYELLFRSFLVHKDDPQVLLVNGMIFKNGTVQLGTWYRLAEGEPDTVAPGEYSIRLLDAHRQLLGETQFDAPFYVRADPGGVVEADAAGFAFTIPYYQSTSTIQILRSGEVIAERAVTPHSPSVRILSPNGGEIVGRYGTQTISWEASDPDRDSLTYAVMYSKDGGSNWEPLAVNLKAKSFTWNTTNLPTGSNYLIRVIVGDGVNTAMDDSDKPFTIAAAAKCLKQDAVNQLNSLVPTGNRTVDGKIIEAASKIIKSLDATLWVDENHLNPKNGNKVFDNEKGAIGKLVEILNSKDATPTIKTKIKDIINQLTGADNEIAFIAISDAETKGSTDCKVNHEIKEAHEEYAEALAAVLKKDYDKAVEEFKHAWRHAEHAMKKAFGDVNADGVVNLSDAVIVTKALGSSAGKPNWNPMADLNGDGKVSLADYTIVTTNFGNAYD